ncbi:MAG: RluA family pseudouridine synthase [Bacteroidota bacterium]|nr:RluA family pseudouridine synthase [Bacteroidota bacterium]
MSKLDLKKHILFENSDYLIVNKPHGITSETENAPGLSSLSQLLKRIYPEAMLCHRLDKETSGCIIAARNDLAYRHASIAFQNKKVQKVYHAIGTGTHKFEELEINLPILKKGNFKAEISKNFGKEALTLVNSLENFKHYTLIQAQPKTGRFHQIRIHLSSMRAPLMGDELYGGKVFNLSDIKRRYNTGKYLEEIPMMSRVALHAYSIHFQDMNDDPINVQAPYPKDMDVTLKMLRQFDSL